MPPPANVRVTDECPWAWSADSCFPIAVEAACSAVGLDPSTADVARLTQTGGLPYHGGPGSNYRSWFNQLRAADMQLPLLTSAFALYRLCFIAMSAYLTAL